jgi:uncharacterized protein with GYD domain
MNCSDVGGANMPTWILLMKLTEEGSKAIKDAPGRIDAGVKLFESMGGKMTDFYATSGEYDYIAVGEAPDDDAAMTFALALRKLGNVSTTSVRAFARGEFKTITERVP